MPTVAAPSDDDVITSGGTLIVILKPLVALPDAASVARTVKLKVPAAPGVPLMAPLEAFSASPPGNDPVEIAQL